MIRRMRNIFAGDGRTVILPIDHGAALNVQPGLKDPGYTITRCFEAGADAVLTTFGVAQNFEKELAGRGLIIRMDGGNSELGQASGDELLFTVDAALRFGADGVACMGFLGTENEKKTLKNLSFLAERCRDWHIPLMAEMLPGGFGSKPPKTVETVKLAARIGAELGASIIKTNYAGEPDEFAEIVEACYVPLVILGGAHSSNFSGLLKVVQDSRERGAAGVAIGRNVWAQPDPYDRMRALVDVVHGGKSAEEVQS